MNMSIAGTTPRASPSAQASSGEEAAPSIFQIPSVASCRASVPSSPYRHKRHPSGSTRTSRQTEPNVVSLQGEHLASACRLQSRRMEMLTGQRGGPSASSTRKTCGRPGTSLSAPDEERTRVQHATLHHSVPLSPLGICASVDDQGDWPRSAIAMRSISARNIALASAVRRVVFASS